MHGARTGRPEHFYPRSPCGERPAATMAALTRCIFLSTLSLRRATVSQCLSPHKIDDFYPRSPCGERPSQPTAAICQSHFYPRSPCGERLGGYFIKERIKIFLSTLSLRRATVCLKLLAMLTLISIHALLAESDGNHYTDNIFCLYFYPRSPCGERRVVV